MKKYCIIGQDDRSKYIRSMYANEKVKIVSFEEADYIIAPIPFTRDCKNITGENITCDELISTLNGKILFTGAIKPEITEKLSKYEYYDLMKFEDVVISNAVSTAEGAIYEAIKGTKFTINSSNVLILGYGNIGKALANMLRSFGCNIFCEARKDKDYAIIKSIGYKCVKLDELEEYLPHMDYIFNTIPSMILDEKRLKLVKNTSLIIDLASTPGGVDFKAASMQNKNVTWALSLPSKIAPQTSAKKLKEKIDKIVEAHIATPQS